MVQRDLGQLQLYNVLFAFLKHTAWLWQLVRPKHVAALDLLL